jgi:hypothetical protein
VSRIPKVSNLEVGTCSICRPYKIRWLPAPSVWGAGGWEWNLRDHRVDQGAYYALTRVARTAWLISCLQKPQSAFRKLVEETTRGGGLNAGVVAGALAAATAGEGQH